MRKMFLRTLVVAATAWVVACGDYPTQPVDTMPALGHIKDQGLELDALEAQIKALFPAKTKGKGKGGGVQGAVLTHLRNIARVRETEPLDAQSKGVAIGQQALGQLNAGKLTPPPYDGAVFRTGPTTEREAVDELVALLTSYVAGSFVLQVVSREEEVQVTTENKFAGVIIESGDLDEIDDVVISIQELAKADCLTSAPTQSQGCFRYDKFPAGPLAAGKFLDVFICVDEEFVAVPLRPFLRLHRFNAEEGLVLLGTPDAAAEAASDVDCTDFDPLPPVPVASVGSNGLLNFASAVGSGLRALLGPQPLFASTALPPAPTRLGGLGTSFSNHGGAVINIRVAGIGNNGGNTEADEVFSSGDLPGSITRLTEAEFDAKTDAELEAEFDVLLVTWDSDSSLDVDWTTRLLPFLNSGGGVIYDGDPNNIGDLSAVVTTSLLDVGGESASGITVSAVVPGLTDGINDFFVNNHIRFATFSTFDPVFSPFLTLTDESEVDHVVGLHGPVGPGCIVLTGPDQDFHGVRGGGGSGLNQYNLLVNELQFVFDPDFCN